MRTRGLATVLTSATGDKKDRQSRVIAELTMIPYPTLKEAARRANLSYDTCKRWHSKDIEFLTELRRARAAVAGEVLDDCAAQIRTLFRPAFEVYRRALAGEKISSQTERLARDVMDRTVGSVEQRGTLSVQHEGDIPQRHTHAIDYDEVARLAAALRASQVPQLGVIEGETVETGESA